MKLGLQRLFLFPLLLCIGLPASATSTDANALAAIFDRIERSYPLPYDKQALSDRAVAALRKSAEGGEAVFDKCLPQATPDSKSKLPPALALALTCAHWVRTDDDEQAAAFDAVATELLSGLDPQSNYISAAMMADMFPDPEEKFGGIGISVKLEEKGLQVVHTNRGAPARGAGLQVDETITAIDGKVPTDLDAAVKQLRGEVGSEVRLQIMSAQGVQREVVLKRQLIVFPEAAVDFERRGDMLVLRFDTLPYDLSSELEMLINEQGKGAKLLVLDLRSNTGGLLDEAVAVADLFLDKGEIVMLRGKEHKDIEHRLASKNSIASNKPIIILTGKRTASGAELIAAALQDHGRAKILGERSYGLGTIQTVLPIDAKRAIRLTTQRMFRPNGGALGDTHVAPDCTVAENSADILDIAGQLYSKGLAACPAATAVPSSHET
jgi:carboxyl-terminal processing protease